MKRVEKVIQRLLPEIAQKRVLEPACGCAGFSIAAAKYASEVICFDLDDQRLNPEATQTPQLRFEIMDATAMRFPDASFDTVVLYNAIGHLAQIAEPVLQECRSVLSAGGAIWIVSSFRMDKAVIQETVLPLLEQMGYAHEVQNDANFMYVRIAETEKNI